MQSRAHGANRTADDRSSFLVAMTVQITEHDDLAVSRRQAQHGPANTLNLLASGRCLDERFLLRRGVVQEQMPNPGGDSHNPPLTLEALERQIAHDAVEIGTDPRSGPIVVR